ncbi:MAG: ABC transporter ATP-binding protein, partial [Gemmobacter sp.]|nr:ABC transporter ATP-binding protein [Gemmobacter sp.]
MNKTFKRANGESLKAIDDVSIDIHQGELVVLLGPSGCGKTTLLRAVAGLETPDSGSIRLGGRDLFDSETGLVLPPEARHVGMVFQSYALWPHMTVAQNVAYPLRMRGVGRDERDRRVQDILTKMRIGDLAQQHPGRISGGQQQRVALARALVCGDGMILFDEPLSNVDAKVRELLRLEILTMQRQFGFTALYVTHDQEEAMALASRIAVVGRGRIEQLGTPEDVYCSPVSLGVARFIGSANELQGRIVDTGVIHTDVGQLRVNPSAQSGIAGSDVILLTRPEHWQFATEAAADTVAGTIVSAAFLGSV